MAFFSATCYRIPQIKSGSNEDFFATDNCFGSVEELCPNNTCSDGISIVSVCTQRGIMVGPAVITCYGNNTWYPLTGRCRLDPRCELISYSLIFDVF